MFNNENIMLDVINRTWKAGAFRAELLELGFDLSQAHIKFSENWEKKGISAKAAALIIAEIELFKLKHLVYADSGSFIAGYLVGLHCIHVLSIAENWYEKNLLSLTVFNHAFIVFKDLVELEKDEYLAKHDDIEDLVKLDITYASSLLDYSRHPLKLLDS
jgi:hypothetical protein